MDILAGKRIEIHRHGRNQGFAFSRSHFRNPTTMKRYSANYLAVKRNHIPDKFMTTDFLSCSYKSSAGILNNRIRLAQNIIQCFSGNQTALKLNSFCSKLFLRERLVLDLDPVNFLNQGLENFEVFLMFSSK